MYVTENSAYFITNQCLFGAYPTQQQIHQLEDWGVNIIVNLTNNDEKKIYPYKTKAKIIHFPIPDLNIPKHPHTFCALVIYLSLEIKNGKKIYIHCKGGHGRSALLVAAILCYYYKITPTQSLIRTTECHSTRAVHSSKPNKNEFWKNKKSPHTSGQRNFVKKLFQQYKITNNSPFVRKGEWLSGIYDDFLMTTDLGIIEGVNGKDLEKYRDELYMTTISF